MSEEKKRVFEWIDNAERHDVYQVLEKAKKRRNEIEKSSLETMIQKSQKEFDKSPTEENLRNNYKKWWISGIKRGCKNRENGGCTTVECGDPPATYTNLFALVGDSSSEFTFCDLCKNGMTVDIMTRELEPFEEDCILYEEEDE